MNIRLINLSFGRIAAIVGLGALCAVSSAQALNIGSPAPPLKVGKWVKGTPAAQFKPGNVYVVEFWATWCGPCKQTIPQLTELAKKYAGKAQFIGVSVWEKPKQGETYDGTQTTVEKFVAGMGDKMSYNVACDNSEREMAKTWMTAAGQNGIPVAFIVDQKSKIAWIGYPWAGLDESLKQVVDGTWDIEAAGKKYNAELEKQRVAAEKAKVEQDKRQAAYDAWLKTPLGEKYAKLAASRKEKRYQEALQLLDEIGASQPDSQVKHPKLDAAMQRAMVYESMGDMDGYYASAKQAFQIMSDEAQKLIDQGLDPATEAGGELFMLSFAMNNLYSWRIADPKSTMARRDFDFAIAVANRTVEITKRKHANWLDTLAWAHFGKGDKAKAIEIEKEAISVAAPQEVEDFKAALKKFQGE